MVLPKITCDVWKCNVCNHEWLSIDNEKSLRCAKCRRPYWVGLRKISNKISTSIMNIFAIN